MAFSPEGTIYLIGGVLIDNNYQHTIDFPNIDAQVAYFQSQTVVSLADYTYVRKDNVIKVQVKFDYLYGVNYMMFRNGSNKWIFSFITDKKYVNENTTELVIETDVMQTYMFNYELQHCYVEREHVSNDTIGLHRADEGLNIGELTTQSKEMVEELLPIAFVMATTVDAGLADVKGAIQTGVYSGVAYYAFDTAEQINTVISALDAGGKGSALNYIFTMPKALIRDMNTTTKKIDSPVPQYIFQNFTKNYSNLNGYTPRNKKLFCYPYNFIEVSNNKGETNIFKFENFTDSVCNFSITSNLAPNPTVLMRPRFYDGETISENGTISLSDYPLCSWTSDMYTNWLAQNQVSNALAVGGSVLNLGVGLATGSPVAVASGLLGVAGTIGAFYEKSIQANDIKGSVSGGANIADGVQTFTIRNKVIRAEYARILDDFFTYYGYKVNELKVPNTKSRPYYNYIKTHECNISGHMDNKDLSKIKDCYNNGITFWHGVTPCNYSLNNAV